MNLRGWGTTVHNKVVKGTRTINNFLLKFHAFHTKIFSNNATINTLTYWNCPEQWWEASGECWQRYQEQQDSREYLPLIGDLLYKLYSSWIWIYLDSRKSCLVWTWSQAGSLSFAAIPPFCKVKGFVQNVWLDVLTNWVSPQYQLVYLQEPNLNNKK